MEKKTLLEKRRFEKVYFREERNKRDELCFIGKVRQFKSLESGEKEFAGELILKANTIGKEDSGMRKVGVYDVECVEMVHGNGWIVESCVWTKDTISMEIQDGNLHFLINGRREKYRTEEGKLLPLFYDPSLPFEPRKVWKSIENKLKYVQADYDLASLQKEWMERCDALWKEYKSNKHFDSDRVAKSSIGERLEAKREENKKVGGEYKESKKVERVYDSPDRHRGDWEKDFMKGGKKKKRR